MRDGERSGGMRISSLLLQMMILEKSKLILKFEGMGEKSPDHTMDLNIVEVDKKIEIKQ